MIKGNRTIVESESEEEPLRSTRASNDLSNLTDEEESWDGEVLLDTSKNTKKDKSAEATGVTGLIPSTSSSSPMGKIETPEAKSYLTRSQTRSSQLSRKRQAAIEELSSALRNPNSSALALRRITDSDDEDSVDGNHESEHENDDGAKKFGRKDSASSDDSSPDEVTEFWSGINQKQSRRKARSKAPIRARAPVKDLENTNYSDLDGFIVNSDEEEEEEEGEEEAESSDGSDENEVAGSDSSSDEGNNSRSRRRKRGRKSGKKSSSERKRKDRKKKKTNSSKSNRKRSKRTIETSSDEDGESDASDDKAVAEDSSEGEEEESDYGPSVYWQVDAMREAELDTSMGIGDEDDSSVGSEVASVDGGARSSKKHHAATSVLSTMFRKSFSRPEAMRLYIEYLARYVAARVAEFYAPSELSNVSVCATKLKPSPSSVCSPLSSRNLETSRQMRAKKDLDQSFIIFSDSEDESDTAMAMSSQHPIAATSTPLHKSALDANKSSTKKSNNILASGKTRNKGSNRLDDIADNHHFLCAARQIENLICTCRESLLGSGAWLGDYIRELRCRPFFVAVPYSGCYSSHSTNREKDDQHCVACGRSSHHVDNKVYLSGPSYDSVNIWSQEAFRWQRALPVELFGENAAAAKRRGKMIVAEEVNNNHVVEDDDEDSVDNAQRSRDDEDTEDNSSDSDAADEQARQAMAQVHPCNSPFYRNLNRSKASSWFLANHCTSRTRLYHTLLHYKFRLMLKIIQRLGVDKHFDDLSGHRGNKPFDFQTVVEAVSDALEDLLTDPSFIEVELQRLEGLLDQASSRYGDRKELFDIWKDDSRRSKQDKSKFQRKVMSSVTTGTSRNSATLNRVAAIVDAANRQNHQSYVDNYFQVSSNSNNNDNNTDGKDNACNDDDIDDSSNVSALDQPVGSSNRNALVIDDDDDIEDDILRTAKQTVMTNWLQLKPRKPDK